MSRIDEALRRAAVVEPASRTPAPMSLDAYPQEDTASTSDVIDGRGGRDRHSDGGGKTRSAPSWARLSGSIIAGPRAVDARRLTGFSESVEGKIVIDQEM